MKSYLVAGLKLTPPNPTFLEGRDALLAAIRANDLADFGVCAQAFARRGFGSLAVAPPRNSTDELGRGGELRPHLERGLRRRVAVGDAHGRL